MPAISITRLELRGLRFLPSFFVHAEGRAAGAKVPKGYRPAEPRKQLTAS